MTWRGGRGRAGVERAEESSERARRARASGGFVGPRAAFLTGSDFKDWMVVRLEGERSIAAESPTPPPPLPRQYVEFPEVINFAVVSWAQPQVVVPSPHPLIVLS